MIKKSKELIVSVTLAYLAFAAMYFSYMYEGGGDVFRMFLPEIASILLMTSVFYFFFQKLNIKFDNIQERSEELKNMGVRDVKVTKSNPFRIITDEILKSKSIYKISIYLQDPSLENLVHIKELFYRRDLMARVRLLISKTDKTKDLELEKEIKSINRLNNKFTEIAFIDKQISNSFVLVDTSLWIIYNNKTELTENAICLNMNADSEMGETFVQIFNNNWNQSLKSSNN